MAVGTRKAAWRRVAEGRQEGAFLSKRALPQMVPFGLTKSEHFSAAVEWSQHHSIPQEETTIIDLDLKFATGVTLSCRDKTVCGS